MSQINLKKIRAKTIRAVLLPELMSVIEQQETELGFSLPVEFDIEEGDVLRVTLDTVGDYALDSNAQNFLIGLMTSKGAKGEMFIYNPVQLF